MKRYTASPQGFTLIEAMVAMVILSIGILAIFTMQISAVKGNAHASRLTSASAINAGEVEKLISVDYDDLDAKAVSNWTDLGTDEPYNKYEYTLTVEDDKPTQDLKRITVEVRDKTSILSRPVTFTYIKYDLP